MRFVLGLLIAFSGLLHAGTLNFPEVAKEVHAPVDAQIVTVDFSFSNTTDKPVTITKYDAACSCMSVQISDGKMTYAPGESGIVRANFDMKNFSGDVEKVVYLWLDDNTSGVPSTQLKVNVHIPLLVSIEPKTLKWDVGASPESQTFKIEMKDEKPIKILSLTSSNPAFQYELKTLQEGKSYEIKITPASTQTPGLAIFRITTDSTLDRYKMQQAFATIHKAQPAPVQPKQ